MLKGHTRIELTNVHTGKKEVIEKHNMITNNLNNIFNYLIGNFTTLKTMTNSYNNQLYAKPLYNSLMGGIILFRDPIDEDVNNVLCPAASIDSITGYASANVNSGSDVKRGSKNLTESMVLDSGYKYVWDFSTSQANGTISALTLADNYACENNPFYMSTYGVSMSDYISGKTGAYAYFPFFVEYDHLNDLMICIKTTDTTHITLAKISLGFKKIGLAGPLTPKIISTQTIVSSIELQTDGWWKDGKDGYYYYYKCVSDSVHTLIRMKKDTLEIDTEFGTKTFNPSLANVTHFCIVGDYVYIATDYVLKKVNLKNTNDITTVEQSGQIYSDIDCAGKAVYGGKYTYFEDDTKLETANYSVFKNSSYPAYRMHISKEGFITCIQSNTSGYCPMFGFLRNNLCTINNLDAPVTKTADKTMKIIYTITET